MKAPKSEFSEQFIELMNNRMLQSYHKYGPLKEAYPFKVNAVKSILNAVKEYEKSGNTEYLVDAANYCMIEYMLPAHDNAHFESTDSNGSAGRVWHGSGRPNQKKNNSE